MITMFCEKIKMGSCTRKKNRISFCLPDDLLSIIFLCLPTNFLYNVVRFVCRRWYNIIQSPAFISAHLQKQSTTNALLVYQELIIGFVVKTRSHSHGGVLEVENLNFEFVRKTGASCNGLLFVIGPIERNINCPSYIINPVTKQYLPLPLFPDVISETESLSRMNCCLEYVAASKVYKVMHYTVKQSFILSVGVDKAWREVDTSGLSPIHKRNLLLNAHRIFMISGWLTCRGFVYWVCTLSQSILTFDLETETFGEIPLFPGYCDDHKKVRGVGLLETETSLCLWMRSQADPCLFMFWFLKNPESGEWEKLFDVNLRHTKENGFHPDGYLKPLGWLRDMELLVFRSYPEIKVYEVNTGKLHDTEEMKRLPYLFGHQFYVESLIPLNNLSLDMRAASPYKCQDEVYSKENMKGEFEECVATPF